MFALEIRVFLPRLSCAAARVAVPSSRLGLPLVGAAVVLALGLPGVARAQFDHTPAPSAHHGPAASHAETDRAYRKDGARHLYARYAGHIYKGKLPPLMYAIAITETEIDENGEVVNAVMVREPAAAKEVSPWVLKLIRAAGPFPKPARMKRVKYLDIWLVDRSGRFQLDTLTEGQR